VAQFPLDYSGEPHRLTEIPLLEPWKTRLLWTVDSLQFHTQNPADSYAIDYYLPFAEIRWNR
jgi:hypothetical protein